MQLYYSFLIFTLGAIFGSFLNVVIYRLPRHESIVHGSSHCTNCQTPIKAYDLIPIISYLILGGKCRKCHHPISLRYPLIELLTAVCFYLMYQTFGLNFNLAIGLILTTILIIITMIDIDTMDIYDRFHIMILGLAITYLFITPVPMIEHVIGFFIISIPLYVIAYLTGGIGGGDIKLMAVSGLLLGYKATLVAFFIAVVLGGIVAMGLLVTKQKERGSQMAFGPFLCLGIYFAYLYGNQVFNWYLTLFS